MKTRLTTLLSVILIAGNLFSQEVLFDWAKQIGSNSTNLYDMKWDVNENFYVSGYFNGVMDFDPSELVYNKTSTGNDGFVAKYDAAGNYLWGNAIQGTGGEYPSGVAIDDNDGSMYVLGKFSQTADFDPSPGQDLITCSNSGNDIFISKYDQAGSYYWTKVIENDGTNNPFKILVDDLGNIYISGYFSGRVDFDPGAGAYEMDAGTFYNLFIASYDANGDFRYARNLGVSGTNEYLSSFSIINDMLILAGEFEGTIDFDLGGGVANLTASTGKECFLAFYDLDFNYIKAMNIDAHSIKDVSIGDNDTVIITGSFYGTTDFNQGIGIDTLTSNGDADVYIALYDKDLNFISVYSFGDEFSDYGRNLYVENNNIYLVGSFSGSIDFDPGSSEYIITSVSEGASYNDVFIAKYNTSGDFEWVRKLGGNQNDIADFIHNKGDVFTIGGTFYGVADFDPSDDQFYLDRDDGNLFFSQYTECFSPIETGSTGDLERSPGESVGQAVIVDGTEPIQYKWYHNDVSIAINTFDYIIESLAFADTGVYYCNISNRCGSIESSQLSISLRDSKHSFTSVIGLGSSGDESIAGIVHDDLGNVYAYGLYENTVDFDPGAGVVEKTSNASTDLFIAKYSPAQELIWVNVIGNAELESAGDIAINDSGYIYICGGFIGTVDFDPADATTFNLTSQGKDAFYAKYDLDGNFLHAQQFISSSTDHATSISVDNDGNVYLGGTYSAVTDIDPGVGTMTLNYMGFYDGFVAKFSSTGSPLWGMALASTSWDNITSIAIDENGNVAATGYCAAILDLDPGPDAYLVGSTYYSAYTVVYDTDGNFIWGDEFGKDEGSQVAFDKNGNIITAGNFRETVHFDRIGRQSEVLYTNGSNDIYIAKYRPDGELINAYQLGGIGDDYLNDIFVDDAGDVYLTGIYEAALDLDMGPGKYMLNSNGGFDVFMAKYDSKLQLDWAKSFGGSSEDRGEAILIDENENIVVAGSFKSNVDFDPDEDIFDISAENTDFFINYFQLYNAPEITSQPVSLVKCFGDSAQFTIEATGSDLTYNWYRNDTLLQNTNTNTITINSLSKDSAGIIKCVIDNECNTVSSSNIELNVIDGSENKPMICMITADEETGDNLVVWEKTDLIGVDRFVVMKQSDTTSAYSYINEQDFDELSVYADIATDDSRESFYKVAAIDTCGNISEESPYHKTILLQYNGYTEGVNLIWQPYEIEGEEFRFLNYVLYRGEDPAYLSPIMVLAGNEKAYIDKDPEAASKLMYYQIGGVIEGECAPNGSKKSNSGPFSRSLSNLEDNRQQASGISDQVSKLSLYPNPMNDFVNVVLPDNDTYQLNILDLTGKVVLTQNNIVGKSVFIQRNNIQPGYYVVELKGAGTYRSQLIIE